ncbi:MAG: DegT/DnrJ/EryC1/StrS family aminotransferase [Armatimonadetes bacterium]|nr:DegT/DnrJ/EryC1/StrS family aminotransferase [Armatimonadota bacterium]
MLKDKPAILGGKPVFDNWVGIVNPVMDRYYDKIKFKLEKIFKSRIVTNANTVLKLEEELARFLDVPYIVAMSSCTLALTLTLQALGLEEKEIIMPSFTIAATVNAAYWNRCKIVFADIDAETFNLDPYEVEKKITPKTKAIMPVHTFGNPVEIKELEKIIKGKDIKLVFDAAQALGAIYHKKRIGNFGEAEVFSGSPTKHFTSIEGGFIATSDKKLAQKLKLTRNYGVLPDYNCILPGLNSRMSEIHALVGLSMLKDIDKFTQNRNKYANLYKKHLKDIPGIRFQGTTQNSYSSYNYLGILINKKEFGLPNKILYKALAKENIMTKIYYHPPVHKHLAYKKYNKVSLKNTENISENIICLPLYNYMEEEIINGICEAIQRIHSFNKEIKVKK